MQKLKLKNDPFLQASYVIANLLRHNDETFIQRQKVLRGAGLLTAIHQSSSDCVRPINTSKLVIFSDFLKISKFKNFRAKMLKIFSNGWASYKKTCFNAYILPIFKNTRFSYFLKNIRDLKIP